MDEENDTRRIDPSQFPSDDHRHELTEGFLEIDLTDPALSCTVYRCVWCTFELRCWEAS